MVQAAIARAKLAHERLERIYASERFKTLESIGAAVRRPLRARRSGFAGKLMSALRVQFGGHEEKPAGAESGA
jgi:hypothetical protein